MSVDGPAVASAPIRQLGSGSTGHQTWVSAHILASVLLALDAEEHEAQKLALHRDKSPGAQLFPDKGIAAHAARKSCKQPHRCILELGAGTGQMAVTLARAGWRGILATDGEASIVKNMKYNVQANRLGHAVRCLKWNWDESPPKGLELADFDLVIGSDLVYYNRSHGMLASVLKSILAARLQDASRPPARALLLCVLRQAHEDAGGSVVHHLSSEFAGSSMQRFIEKELPSQSLIARHLPISAEIFDLLGDELTREALASTSVRLAYQLYEVMLDVETLVL